VVIVQLKMGVVDLYFVVKHIHYHTRIVARILLLAALQKQDTSKTASTPPRMPHPISRARWAKNSQKSDEKINPLSKNPLNGVKRYIQQYMIDPLMLQHFLLIYLAFTVHHYIYINNYI